MNGCRLKGLAIGHPAGRHFMQTGAAVVSKPEVKPGAAPSLSTLQFKGMLLECIDGMSLDKRLEDDASFCDVDYITTMLVQVFTALDAAGRTLGFQHCDLRISNIMEHVPADTRSLWQEFRDGWRTEGWDSPQGAALARGNLIFKIVDFGRSTINDRKSAAYLSSCLAAVGFSRQQQSSLLSLGRIPAGDSLLDRIYRWLYGGRSDVWRLLRSLATRLDGRAWPKRKAAQVRALHGLIEEVVNVKLEARFFQDEVVQGDGSVRRVGSNELVLEEAKQEVVATSAVPTLDVTSAPRRAVLWRWLRGKALRLWSRLTSRRPRVTARQVLVRMAQLGLEPITLQPPLHATLV